jgi:hypothetical protein
MACSLRISMRIMVVAAALGSGHLRARAETPPLSNAQIARETSDPTSDLWYFFTEAALATDPGRAFKKSNAATLEFQPSLPLTLGNSWRILNFPDLTLASEGTPSGQQINGIKSFSWMPAISPPARQDGFAWGVGPYLAFPAATASALGESLWQVGPGAVISWRSPNFVTSALIQSGWTTSGDGEEAGSLRIQYNIQYFIGNGFQVGLGRPRIEYTWGRDRGGRWDLPVGLDVGKVFRLGKMPIKVLLEYDFYMLNDSQWKPEHLIRVTFIPVLRNPFGASSEEN